MALLKNINRKIKIRNLKQQHQLQQQQITMNKTSLISNEIEQEEFTVQMLIIFKHVISLYYWTYALKKIYQLYKKESKINTVKVVILTVDSLCTLGLFTALHYLNIKSLLLISSLK